MKTTTLKLFQYILTLEVIVTCIIHLIGFILTQVSLSLKTLISRLRFAIEIFLLSLIPYEEIYVILCGLVG